MPQGAFEQHLVRICGRRRISSGLWSPDGEGDEEHKPSERRVEQAQRYVGISDLQAFPVRQGPDKMGICNASMTCLNCWRIADGSAIARFLHLATKLRLVSTIKAANVIPPWKEAVSASGIASEIKKDPLLDILKSAYQRSSLARYAGTRLRPRRRSCSSSIMNPTIARAATSQYQICECVTSAQLCENVNNTKQNSQGRGGARVVSRGS
jgi:hypothetical protein